jgi:ankyrin repeat protein
MLYNRDMANRGHRRIQFGTKALLLLVLLIAVPLAWVAAERRERQNERQAAIHFERLEGLVGYNWGPFGSASPPGAPWLRAVLGDEFFVRPISVVLRNRTELTDADIRLIQSFPDLEDLALDNTCISDTALTYLKGMRRLKTLDLAETHVTDAGLKHLRTLPRLERLNLEGTLATAAGVADLQAALPNCKITHYGRPGDGEHHTLARIHAAARAGDVGAVRDELVAGVSVDLRVSTREDEMSGDDKLDGTTPLMWAASRGEVAAVRCLVAFGADVNAKNSDGVTPLMAAAGAVGTIDGDPLACVVALLKAGANVDDADGERRTALFYACGEGTFFDEPPNAFVQATSRLPDPFRGMRPFMGTATVIHHDPPQRHGDEGRVKALLIAGADANAADVDGVSALMTAARNTDAHRLEALLDAGADIHYQSPNAGSPLRAAAYSGDFAMFRLLLDAGAKPGRGLLAHAAGSDREAAEKVELLLKLGADIEEPGACGETPLLSSLWHSSTAAPVLLKAGANPHVRNSNGEGALVLAAENDASTALRLLLELGLDPNERSKQSPHPTALILAAESQREAAEKVRHLIAAGAILEAKDDRGATALLAASRRGNMQAIAVLAEAGAQVDVSGGPHRMTPLLYVAGRGAGLSVMREETGGNAARALILRGANVNAVDKHGRTARKLAEAIHHTEVLKVLDEFGG